MCFFFLFSLNFLGIQRRRPAPPPIPSPAPQRMPAPLAYPRHSSSSSNEPTYINNPMSLHVNEPLENSEPTSLISDDGHHASNGFYNLGEEVSNVLPSNLYINITNEPREMSFPSMTSVH